MRKNQFIALSNTVRFYRFVFKENK